MNTANMSAEIQLYNAMTRNKLNVKEAIKAMDSYANDKDFQKQLDDYYGSELYIADDFDEVTSDHQENYETLNTRHRKHCDQT